ncbi:hypothetical protein EMQ25_11430 [Arsenicitalea aurantiaca]|uniref:Peptidoglycan binding-like domain-containing protein n=2 Tax=Arsenicitalea aurantiaca TaxID=1783274 RepID=A0A433X8N1_9HYPH|nr:hypothetical protein EMQ25_11430 [Arsenicitalea aurantiaca]
MEAAQAEKARQELEAELAFIRRVQTALSSLGFYNMEVDGKVGPGTRAAVAAYQAAFDLRGAFSEADLGDLEERASAGWRSAREERQAAEAGFTSRQEFITASTAGFDSKGDWDSARYYGITSSIEYYLFAESDFGDYPTFIAAQEAGFDSAEDFAHAERLGFAQARPYWDFLDSGFADKISYDAHRLAIAEAEHASEACKSAAHALDWLAGLEACFRANRADPQNGAIKAILEDIRGRLSAALIDSRALLEEKQQQLVELTSTERDAVAQEPSALRDQINALANRLVLGELHLQVTNCAASIHREDWKHADSACSAQVEIDQLGSDQREQAELLLAELEIQHEVATENWQAQQTRAKQEAERLAREEATGQGTTLLNDVEAFSSRGGRFSDGVEVARALVALKQSLAAQDATRINSDVKRLERLLELDAVFVEDRMAQLLAAEQAATTGALLARRRLEDQSAFIIDHIARNVTAAETEALLKLQERLEAILVEGNAERVTSAQLEAGQIIQELGLAADLHSFAAAREAPLVTDADLKNADAEAARASRALDAALEQARSLLADIEDFARSGKNFVEPISVARAIGRLKRELSDPQLDGLTASHAALYELVHADELYGAAMSARHHLNDVALANAIATAVEEGTLLNTFLLDHISRNLTDDEVLPLIELQATLEGALADEKSSNIVRIVAGAQASIGEYGLTAAAMAFAESEAARRVQPAVETIANGLSITLANAALLEGDNDALVVLRVADGTAPYLTTNLLGDLTVEGGTVHGCWVHTPPKTGLPFLLARRKLKDLGIEQVEVSQCLGGSAVADLILLERGAFLSLSPSQAQPIISSFEDGRLVTLVSVQSEETADEAARLDAEVQSIKLRLGNELLHGYGILKLASSDSAFCAVAQNLDAHANLLARHLDLVTLYLSDVAFSEALTQEQAFVAAQRGLCEAIYGPDETLRVLMDAMARDNIKHELLPLWIETDTVQTEVARLDEVSRQELMAATLADQELRAAAQLQSAQEDELRAASLAQQVALRAEHHVDAAGAQKTIMEMMRSFVDDQNPAPLLLHFPKTHKVLSALRNDRWTITTVSDDLLDYGTAVWQDRRIKAILVRIGVERENAILGRYESDCYVLGQLLDTEFRVVRDPFEGDCMAAAETEGWKQGHGFESLWHLVDTPSDLPTTIR